jgi:asparagine synthase (glutamine-hydrolysing)
MCGFAGVFEYATAEGSVSERLITSMRESLAHRGPDGAGLFLSDDRRVGLGHRRLAIVDIANGAQPMFGSNGECLVFNGEIYNYARLRAELEDGGARFATNCDTEVILHMYARDGVECVRSMSGMFAFALWDPAMKRIFLARDRVGEKPLYFCDRGGRLVFGSEIKALLEHPSVNAEIDPHALDAYMTHLVTPSPFTLFRGIRKLAAGEMATCDASGLRVSRWWDGLARRDFAETSLEDAGDEVRTLLERSIDDRLMSDVPIGVLLSGGVDSTSIVAMLAERARGLATFSVGFAGDRAFDERDEARRVANHFGTDHHEVSLAEADALASLGRLVHHADEPVADPVCLPLYFVCDLAARNGVKVVLGGEGADELFWGYPRYEKIVRWLSAIAVARRLPRGLRRICAASISPRLFPSMREFAEGVACERLPPMHLQVGVPRHERSQVLERAGARTGWTPSGPATAGTLETLAFDTQEYDFGVRLPERLLMRLDRFSMARGVEARAPYLDHELVEFVYRLPPALKIAHGETKLALRRAVRGLVPPWVLARGKQGFEAPVIRWFGSRLGALLGELLREDAVRSYFDAEVLRRALRDHRSRARASALWPVLNFALWHIAWIERREIEDVIERAAARVRP